MPRTSKAKTNAPDELQLDLFDLNLFLKTIPHVPALRKLVKEGREGNSLPPTASSLTTGSVKTQTTP